MHFASLWIDLPPSELIVADQSEPIFFASAWKIKSQAREMQAQNTTRYPSFIVNKMELKETQNNYNLTKWAMYTVDRPWKKYLPTC